MNSLTRYQHNNLELLIDTKTGECFATQGMIARLCKEESTNIASHLRGVKISAKPMQVKDSRGVNQLSKVFNEQAIMKCLLKYNPQLLEKCMELGLRVFLHKIAGYEVKSTVIEQSVPQTYAQALLEAGRLALENEKLKLQATEDKPKVEFAETIAVSDDTVTINEYAKMIGTGRNRLFSRLRDLGIVMQQSTLVYQKHIDSGYFEVSEVVTGIGVQPYCVITGKGQLWLHQKLGIKAPLVKQGKLFD